MKCIHKIFFAWLLVLIYTDKALSLTKRKVSDQFKLHQNKANGYVVNKIEKDEDLEYPGRDYKLTEILNRKWKEYYECLRQKENQTSKPELRRLIEGQNTVFECEICVRPFQNYEEIKWHYKPLTPGTNITELQLLDLTPEMKLLPNKTLKIFNLGQYFEGLYVCFHYRDPVSAFVLEISSNDTIERVATAYMETKETFSLSGTEYSIEYQWDDWSECSSCKTVGRKFRYGTCSVIPKGAGKTLYKSLTSKSNWNDLVYDKIQLTAKRMSKRLTDIYNKIKNSTTESEVISGWEEGIIDKFSKGVPCASGYLPLAALEKVKSYSPAKAIVKFCQESCQEVEIFEVQDGFGKTIEIANNSAGIYSMHQQLPILPPPVERVSITGELGKDIVIQCPGTSLTNTPVTWAVNKKVIFPEVIATQSQGRFVIDLVNRICLKKLRLKDSHTYSCWHRDKLIGTVHLDVEDKLRISFNHHLTLFGVAAVIGTFLFVGAKVLTRNLNSKRK